VSGVETSQRQKRTFSYTWIIALVVINYLVTWAPALTFNYTLPYSYPRAASASLLVVFNILLDPLIYIWKIKEFRKQFLIMLRCRRPENNQQMKSNVTTIVIE
jgi:membrane protease YdiL (CAAX protease family)